MYQGDSNWSNVSLLCNFNGISGATNVVDSATGSNYSVTGNAQINSTTAKFGGTSLKLDGTGDYVTVPHRTGIDLGSSDFTLEFWVYYSSVPTSGNTHRILSKWGSAGSRSYYVGQFNNGGTQQIVFLYSADGTATTGTLSANFNPTLSTWYHIAVSRSGGTLYVHSNGTQLATTSISGSIFSASSESLYFGMNTVSTGIHNGYLDDIRITKDLARYTAAFTAPTKAHPIGSITDNAVYGDLYWEQTSLLLSGQQGHAATTFHNHAIVDIQPSTVGGTAQHSYLKSRFPGTSISFDGNGDYLYYAYNSALDIVLGDFTAEAWIYPTHSSDTSGRRVFAASGGTAAFNSTTGIHWYLQIINGVLSFAYWNGSAGAAINTLSGAVQTNTWQHVAVSYDQTTIRIFVNGVLKASGAAALARPSTNPIFSIGTINPEAGSASTAYTGYMQDIRVTKGVCRYADSFTLSPLPFPVGSEQQSDPHWASVGAYILGDQSVGFNLAVAPSDYSTQASAVATSNARQVPSFRKVSEAPITFYSAESRYLTVANNTNLVFGTGDFCIDFWILASEVASGTQTILSKGTSGAGSTGWDISISAASKIVFTTGATTAPTTVLTSSGSLTTTAVGSNVFHHIAVARESGVLYMYINGVSQGSAALTTNFAETNDLQVGRRRASDQYLGTSATRSTLIDGLRLTKGTSRGFITDFSPSLGVSYGLGPVQGNILVQGQTAAMFYASLKTAVQGTIDWQGLVPTTVEKVQVTALQGGITFTGQTPDIIRSGLFTAVQGHVVFAGQQPALTASVATVQVLTLEEGRGVSWSPTLTFKVGDTITLAGGRGVTSVPVLLGGATLAEGRGVTWTPTLTFAADNQFTLIGRGVSSENAYGTMIAATSAYLAKGRGVKAKPILLCGATLVEGRGVKVTFSGTMQASERMVLELGRGVATRNFVGTMIAPATMTLVGGRGVKAYLNQIRLVDGRGVLSDPRLVFTFTGTSADLFAEAMVMNMNTNEVSRFTNFPFMHIARINGAYYGIKSDGLFKLTGDYDLTPSTKVNGTIVTKDTDFGIYQSKNVPFVYLDGDDDYTVTPYVDSVAQPSQASSFSGRKVKLARGSKGRYWTFKVEGIKKLQGAEFLPEILHRRVK